MFISGYYVLAAEFSIDVCAFFSAEIAKVVRKDQIDPSVPVLEANPGTIVVLNRLDFQRFVDFDCYIVLSIF